MKTETRRNFLPLAACLLQLLACHNVWSFAPAKNNRLSGATPQKLLRRNNNLFMSEIPSDEESPDTSPASEDRLEQIKEGLVSCCTRSTKPSVEEVQRIIQELEETAEQIGVGQASSISGLMNGEWYAPCLHKERRLFFLLAAVAFVLVPCLSMCLRWSLITRIDTASHTLNYVTHQFASANAKTNAT